MSKMESKQPERGDMKARLATQPSFEFAQDTREEVSSRVRFSGLDSYVNVDLKGPAQAEASRLIIFGDLSVRLDHTGTVLGFDAYAPSSCWNTHNSFKAPQNPSPSGLPSTSYLFEDDRLSINSKPQYDLCGDVLKITLAPSPAERHYSIGNSVIFGVDKNSHLVEMYCRNIEYT